MIVAIASEEEGLIGFAASELTAGSKVAIVPFGVPLACYRAHGSEIRVLPARCVSEQTR